MDSFLPRPASAQRPACPPRTRCHFQGALLGGAHLENAYLGDANLSDANLNGAYLNGARGWTEEQLRAAQSFKGATMPDGQTLRGAETPNGPTFEAWLKDKKSRGED